MSEPLSIGTLGVILMMAAITYLWRASGFFTMGLIAFTPRIKRGLEALPGAIVVSTVLPLVARTGPVAAFAVGVAALTMIVARNEFLAVAVGVAVAASARAML